MSIPDLFRCPISLDLFTDPVTLCTGQTYDRPCIEKWISSGNFTCPVTMLRLHDLSMVPNGNLRQLIGQWVDQVARSQSLLLAADHHRDEELSAVKQILESQEPLWGKKLEALQQLRAFGNEVLIRFGFFRLLLELAFRIEAGCSRPSLEVVELALVTAAKLAPLSDPGCLNMIKQEPKLGSLLALLEKGTPLIKITLCHLLEAGLSQAKELSSMIRNSGDIQRSIISLIHCQDDQEHENGEVSEAGVKFLLALCRNCTDQNHQKSLEKMVQLGAVRSLVRYIIKSLNRGRCPGLGAAMVAVEVLLEVEGGKEALLGEESGVKALVKMVFRVSDHQGSESAVKSLIVVCSESGEAREEAVKVGVLTQLLLLLQSQCSGRAKAKARLMLKLLRAMWAKDPVARTNHVIG